MNRTKGINKSLSIKKAENIHQKEPNVQRRGRGSQHGKLSARGSVHTVGMQSAWESCKWGASHGQWETLRDEVGWNVLRFVFWANCSDNSAEID